MRKYDLADFLLDMQGALWLEVEPFLRAVVAKFEPEKQYAVALFFFDREITDELLATASYVTVEVDLPWDFLDSEVFTILPPTPCPIEGYLVYHRYEPEFFPPDQSGCIAPFAHKPWYARLVAQQVLLGMVTPSLRAVVVDYEMENKKVLFQFEYDGEVTEFLRNLVIEVIDRAKVFFPGDVEITQKITKIEKVDIVPKGKNIWHVYRRKEPI